LVSGSNAAFQSFEATFHQDLNHDGATAQVSSLYIDGWHL